MVENGVAQKIAQFSTQAFTGPAGQASSPSRRQFFIVLGTGELNVPVRGLDAIIEFVRTRLVDGDRVGLLAYLHLVPMTTDRTAIVRLLDRYRERYVAVQALIDRDKTRTPGGRTAGSPSWPLTPETQQAIESVFDAPGIPPVEHFAGGSGGRGQNYHDLTYLLRTLAYLRQVDGEKHLVFISVRGFPVGEGLQRIVRQAAAARVAVSIIQTGGLRGSAAPDARLGPYGPPAGGLDSLAAADDRAMAELTGGQASFFQDAVRPLETIARVTSFQYLLGYYPAVPPKDGEYREVKVAVTRRGARLLYRHGTEARPRPQASPDLRRLFAESRILFALSIDRELAHIPLSVTATTAAATDGATAVTVDVVIDPRWVTFGRTDDKWLTFLDVGVFARDADGRVAGESWGRVDLVLDAAAYARVKRERIRFRTSVLSPERPASVKVGVFEYEADRVAHATIKVR